jgi:ketosteroid isomerase-like protein
MSQENIELVRTLFAAWNRGDLDDLVSRFFHPEAEWHPYLSVLESRGKVYRGHDAILKMFSDLQESFGESLRVEAIELFDRGEQVVGLIEAQGTGGSSGVEVRQRWAQVATIRQGLILRVEPYPDLDAALEAAGLPE